MPCSMYSLLGSNFMYIGKSSTKICLVLNFRHCSWWFKSRFKNSQAAERKIQNLQGSTDRETDLTNQESISAEFYYGPKPTKTFRVCV